MPLVQVGRLKREPGHRDGAGQPLLAIRMRPIGTHGLPGACGTGFAGSRVAVRNLAWALERAAGDLTHRDLVEAGELAGQLGGIGVAVAGIRGAALGCEIPAAILLSDPAGLDQSGRPPAEHAVGHRALEFRGRHALPNEWRQFGSRQAPRPIGQRLEQRESELGSCCLSGVASCCPVSHRL
jgi:hypothetical protein